MKSLLTALKLFLLVSVVVFIWAVFLPAQNIEEDFRDGIEYYNDGDYVNAIDIFSSLLEKGYRRGEIYYNLGCSYYKVGSLGKAILNFNRAIELNPSDEDARINLEYARKFTIDKIEEADRGFFVEIFEGVFKMFDINTGLMISSALLWLFAILIIVIIWYKIKSRLIWYLFSVLLVLVILSATIGVLRVSDDISYQKGVLIAKQADVFTGPGDEFSLQFTAHEGLEFFLETSRDGYWRVRLINGIKGWVKQEAVGKV